MYLKDESATLLFATQLAQRVTKLISKGNVKPSSISSSTALSKPFATSRQPNFTIFLKGDLGAGKTCFARGFLRGLGYEGKVKSPTFTLVEPYQLSEISVYHFDLYRLSDPGELEYLGMRDFLDNSVILLIEWPERGGTDLPNADIEIQLRHCQDTQQEGRQLDIDAVSKVGQQIISNFSLL